MLGDLTPLQVLARNQMGNNQTGLFINKIGQQGWSGFPYDNEWDPNFTWGNNENFATVVYDDDPIPPAYNGNESPFYVQSNSLPYLPPATSNVPQGGVAIFSVPFISTSGSFLSCPSIFTSPSFMVSHENYYKNDAKMVLNDTIRSGARDINEKWMSNYGLYSLMENDSVLQSDSTLKVFYDSCYISNMGILHRAAALLAIEPDGKTLVDMADYADTLKTFTPVNNTEENWLTVLKLTMNNLLDSTVIDSNEAATLRSIASLCPYEDGFGVYMARSALLEVDTLPSFIGFNECEASPLPTSELRREENFSASSMPSSCKLYPNPTDNLLNIEYTILQQINGKVEIFTIAGQKILDQALEYSKSKRSLELGQLLSGTYFIRITGVMTSPVNYKITVLK
jgi:hypothetical protein